MIPAASAPGPIVICEGLTRSWGPVNAVDRLNLQVPRGAVLGLVGPNGAGKTTLMRMIAGLLEPTRGRILVDGLDLETHPREVQRRLAFLPDFFGLYDELTVAQYLNFFALAYRLPPAVARHRITACAAAVSIGERLEHPLVTLSRGLRQRVAIARSLLHDPPLVMLDEPAAGLDPEARFELQSLLKSLAAAGKTLIVSSHILAELEEYCDHVAMMHAGRLVESGSIREVHSRHHGTRTVQVAALTPLADVATEVSRQPGVSAVTTAAPGLTFRYSGDDAGLAEILAVLVRSGARITGFAATNGGMQDAYLSLMRGTRE